MLQSENPLANHLIFDISTFFLPIVKKKATWSFAAFEEKLSDENSNILLVEKQRKLDKKFKRKNVKLFLQNKSSDQIDKKH